MSKSLKTNYKKLIVSLVAATFSLGAVMPVSYLQAETMNSTVTANSIKIKDATLTFKDAVPAAKGHIGFMINATLEKESGIPDDVTDIFVSGQGKVTIDGKLYAIGISGPGKFKRVSSTTAELQLSAIPTTGQKENKGVAKNITPALLKGKSVEITMTRIAYNKIVEATSDKFNEQIKNVPKVQGVSVDEAGFGEAKRWIKANKTLPEKGLNIPVVDEGQSMIDNIGFTDGKLQIRTKEPASEYIDFYFRDSAGKYITDYGEHVKDTYIHIYNIKDATELVKCKLETSVCIKKASDVETKTATCVF